MNKPKTFMIAVILALVLTLATVGIIIGMIQQTVPKAYAMAGSVCPHGYHWNPDMLVCGED